MKLFMVRKLWVESSLAYRRQHFMPLLSESCCGRQRENLWKLSSAPRFALPSHTYQCNSESFFYIYLPSHSTESSFFSRLKALQHCFPWWESLIASCLINRSVNQQKVHLIVSVFHYLRSQACSRCQMLVHQPPTHRNWVSQHLIPKPSPCSNKKYQDKKAMAWNKIKKIAQRNCVHWLFKNIVSITQ